MWVGCPVGWLPGRLLAATGSSCWTGLSQSVYDIRVVDICTALYDLPYAPSDSSAVVSSCVRRTPPCCVEADSAVLRGGGLHGEADSTVLLSASAAEQ